VQRRRLDLILGLSPGDGEPWEYELIKKLFPQDWKAYCEFHWGEDSLGETL
jgi:hypothetical protein